MTANGSMPRRGATSLVPAGDWLRTYERRWLAPDVVGGLAAGSVVVPQAIAYASIADLPAEVGLYTCIVPMLVYVVLGGSRTLSMSTTSTVAVLTGSTLLSLQLVGGADDPARDLATLTMLVGTILLGARALRLGWLIDNISDATLTGIKVGVGLTVAAGQLPKLVGVDGDPTADAFVADLLGVVDDLGHLSGPTVALSGLTIAVLLVLRRFAPQVPAPLVAVGMGIVLVAVWSVDQRGVALIDPVPSGLPTPIAPGLEGLDRLIGGAFAIAIMCFLETASVAGAVRHRDEPPIDNDQELAANGVACILGGVFRAMPAAGGFSQTAMNQRAGSRTQVSGLVTALLAVACALFLGGILSDLPEATLSAMVLVAVLGLIEPSELGRYWRIDRLSFWVAVATAVAGLVLGLLAAVVVGVVLTLVLVLHELNTIGVTELQLAVDEGDVRVAGPDTEAEPGLLILRVDGPLYTASIRRVRRAIVDAVERRAPGTLVLDTSAVAVTTLTVIDQLVELDGDLADRGVDLWFAAVSPRTLEVARRTPRWRELTAAGRVHATPLAAVRAHRAGHE